MLLVHFKKNRYLYFLILYMEMTWHTVPNPFPINPSSWANNSLSFMTWTNHDSFITQRYCEVPTGLRDIIYLWDVLLFELVEMQAISSSMLIESSWQQFNKLQSFKNLSNPAKPGISDKSLTRPLRYSIRMKPAQFSTRKKTNRWIKL